MAKYKIWWQSSTRDGGFPAYKKAVEDHAKKYLSDEFTLEMHGVPYGTSELGWMSFKMINDHEIMHNMLQIEERGFDAVAFGCFQDPVLQETRELIDVPVLAMGQNSLLWAQMYGRRPCIVTYEKVCAEKSLLRLMDDNGMTDRMITPVAFDLTLDVLGQAFDSPGKVIDLFQQAAQRAVALGADVILPGCGLLNLILSNNGANRVKGTGVPIMDVTAVLMKATETAVILKKLNGFGVSREGYYAKPNADLISTVRDIYYR